MKGQALTLAAAAALVTGCSDLPTAFTRAPASAAAVTSAQTVLVGSPALLPPAVLVRDHEGVVLAGVAVHFAVQTGGGSIGTADAVTDDAGIASAGTWTIGNTAQTNTVTATVDGINGGPVVFTARVVAIKQVSGGLSHTCAVTIAGTGSTGTTGEVFCWGNNSNSQLGGPDAPGTNLNVGRQAGTTGISLVDAGFNHTCALSTSGNTVCWGRNNSGQLGDGTVFQRQYPGGIAGALTFTSIAVGADHGCGLNAAGTAYCWGLNANGQLGDGSTFTRLAPVPVSGALKFQMIAARGNHTCAVATTNVTYCWGENLNGGLGDGTKVDRNVPTAVSGGQVFLSLALGNLHSCGVMSAGAAYCWGANALGQLGDGTTTEQLTPTAVAGGIAFSSLASRGAHTCGLSASDGLAYCWGENANGQLGDGTKAGRQSPVAVIGGQQFTRIAAGSSHTCAVTPIGQAFCWGANASGQLGDGSFTERLAPVMIRLK